jgi:hypothetical protein
MDMYAIRAQLMISMMAKHVESDVGANVIHYWSWFDRTR